MRDWQQPIVRVSIIAAFISAHATAQAQEATAEDTAQAATASASIGGPFVDRKDNIARPAASYPWLLPDEVGIRLLAGRFSGFAGLQGVEQDTRTSFFPDLVLRFRLANEHSLQTGVAYVQKGTENLVGNVATLDYITIPLLYRINPRSLSPSPWLQPYASVGGYLGVLMDSGFENDDVKVSNYDFGWSVGAGANVHVSPAWILDLGVQYSQGFMSAVEDADRTNRTFLLAVAATWDLGGDDDNDRLLNRSESRACWTSPEDWDEWAGKDGCHDADNDNDGLRDELDSCRNGPEDWDGFRDGDGCPDPDNDNDTFADLHDQCDNQPVWGPLARPSVAALEQLARVQKSRPGCFPEHSTFDIWPRRDRLRLRDGYLLDNFGVNSARFNTTNHVKAREALDEIAEFLKIYEFVDLSIRGHMSVGEKPGTDLARATTVKDYLANEGVPVNRLNITGLGICTPASQDCPKFSRVAPPRPGPKPQKSQRLKDLESLDADTIRADDQLAREFQEKRGKYGRAVKKWQERKKRYADHEKASNAAEACRQRTGPRNNRRVTFEVR